MKQNKVAANLGQDYTSSEKAQARNNIGAAEASALSAEITRATNAEKAAKTEVVAGPGISVSRTTGTDGNNIFTVGNSSSSLYKTLQGEIDQPYAPYGFISNLHQTRNGEVSITCSYISAATESDMGLMSSSDKTKLDGIASGAEVNQNAWSNLQVGGTLIAADSKTDTLSLTAGNNITLTPSGKNVTIAATDTTYSAGNGLSLSGTTFSVDTSTIQEKLTAGSNIQLNGSTISATDTTYSAGSGLSLSGTTFSVDTGTIQQKLTAGSNIQINGSTISATDTTYSAGSNVQISSANVISATDTTYSAGSGLSLSGTTFSVDTSTIQQKLTAGSNIQLNGNTISATDTTYSAGSGISINGSNVISCTVPAGASIVTQNNGQGGMVENAVSKLSIDTDYGTILTDGTARGIIVPEPNTPSTAKVLEVAAGSDIPSWVNPAYVEYIQFNYSNQSTAQDSVYTAIANAYAAGKLPILWCAVANASLYWVPTAYGANGYSFSRSTNNYHYLATINSTTHVFTISQSEIVDYTAGTNVTIDANHQISATDTTYTAGTGIAISNSNVISNTMHQDTYGLMISYNTLVNSGTTEHTIGPWKIRVVKDAMAAFDSSPSTGGSLHIYFGHSDFLDGSITNGRTLVDTYEPWADGNYATVYQAHNQWGFNGAYSAGPSNGYQIGLISPDYDNTPAKACPTHMRGYKFTINCGIDRADWLECEANALYINNNTSITSNALRLLLRFKYFYV